MSANTTFWRYAVVALAVFGSAVAVPLSTVDEPAKNDNRPSNVEPTSSQLFAASNPTDGTVKPPLQLHSETTSVGSDFPVASETGLSLSTVANEEKTGADVPAKTGADTVAVQQSENVQVSDPPTVAAGPDSSSFFSSAGPGPGPSSKPYYRPVGVQTVQFGGPPPAMPFIMEFLQPFQPFAAFQPFSPFVPDNRKQPFKQHYQPFPFGAPADPFANAVPSFNQLVNAYTNEFRTSGGVMLGKPKRHVRINTTSSIPPIPLLFNIVLHAFGHEPSDMLASLDKDMSQMGNADNMQDVPDKPVNKTTSKTEIIDGHLVQINETVYSNGDANHKSFFHIKEIKVLPESMNNKKIGNEAVTPAIPTDDLEKKKEDTNEIRPDSSVETFAVDVDDKQNSIKKTREPVPLEDHYQMAASSRYAPYAPWYPSWSPTAAMYYNRPPPPPPAAPVNYNRPPPPPPPAASVNYNRPPPPPPVSLHGDTYVNELMAAQQQANGVNAALPPDVEFVDLNGKPQQMQGGQFYYNDHHNGPKKFPGRKY